SDDRNERARNMPEKKEDDCADDERFFANSLTQGRNSANDQRRTIIRGDDLDARRKRGLDFFQLLFYCVNDSQTILSRAHDHDAAHHFSSVIERGNAATEIWSYRYGCYVAQENRNSAAVHSNRNRLDIRNRFNVAQSADDVLTPGNLNRSSSHIIIARP